MKIDKMDNWELSGLNSRVIVRSNNDEPYKIGNLIGFKILGNISTEVPIIRLDSGEEVISFGVVIPYSKEMEDFLDTLSFSKQWEILKDISMSIRILSK